MKHASEYLLYGRFGHRYDMHTPNYHYQHDHDFIIKEIQKTWRSARVLDIGCGSGVFLEKALQAGLDPVGLDPAAAMLGLACEKVGEERVYLMGMQDLEFQQEFHAIVSLSWVLNYAANVSELKDILRRIKLALLPGGRVFFRLLTLFMHLRFFQITQLIWCRAWTILRILSLNIDLLRLMRKR